MIGFIQNREQPHTHPNLGSNGSTVGCGMGWHGACPGTGDLEASRTISSFARPNDNQLADDVRAAAAHRDSSGL